MTALRQQFQAQFVTLANARLRRALAALSADPPVDHHELHGLAGDAGMLGLTDISQTAIEAMKLTAGWLSAAPSSEQQLGCARILRSLMALVGALAPVATASPEAPSPTRRALVIDDSELVAGQLADALRGAGFVSATASTLEGVMASMRDARPDVVLVDANMPGVDVGVLCERIREHARGSKLIIVSATTDDELRRIAEAVGADGFVDKLHGTAPVVERVAALLGGEGAA